MARSIAQWPISIPFQGKAPRDPSRTHTVSPERYPRTSYIRYYDLTRVHRQLKFIGYLPSLLLPQPTRLFYGDPQIPESS